MFFGENSARAEKCPQSIALLNVWQTSAMLSSSRSLKFALSEYSAKEAVESCCLGRCPLSPSPILFIPFYLPKFSHNFHPRRRTEREERKAAEQLAFQTSRIQQRSFFFCQIATACLENLISKSLRLTSFLAAADCLDATSELFICAKNLKDIYQSF